MTLIALPKVNWMNEQTKITFLRKLYSSVRSWRRCWSSSPRVTPSPWPQYTGARSSSSLSITIRVTGAMFTGGRVVTAPPRVRPPPPPMTRPSSARPRGPWRALGGRKLPKTARKWPFLHPSSPPFTENDVGKMKKNQCAHCFETYHKDSIWRHSKLCELYQKFTINGSECSVCLKIFESRKELNGHIGRKHKKELNELTKTKGTYLYYLNWNVDEFM